MCNPLKVFFLEKLPEASEVIEFKRTIFITGLM